MVAIQDDTATVEPVATPPTAGPDESRLEQLVEAEPVVRRICRSRLGYWDGDDAAQEALLSTWRAVQRPDFEDRGSLVPYAACAARSFSGRADRWRAGAGVETKHPRAVPAGDQSDAWLDPSRGPDEEAEHAEAIAAARIRVGELLGSLTPRQREAVVECALRGRDTDQVADELGLTASSVRSNQVRAMARMRELCGTRSTNPLAANRSDAEQYARRRQEWETLRANREQAEGRVIPRRASRHHAARVAAGQDLTTPVFACPGAAVGAADPVARASEAVTRARRSVADDLDLGAAADYGGLTPSHDQHEAVAVVGERSGDARGAGAA